MRKAIQLSSAGRAGHVLSSRCALGQARSLSTQQAKEVTVKLDKPFDLYLLDKGPAETAATTRDELLYYHELMFRMRRQEISADTLYKGRLVVGFCHLYDGQEAVAAGMKGSMKSQDTLITAYRDHCQQLASGDTVEGVLRELLGRQGGCAKGKGGSMHLYNMANNFYGGHAIVGSCVPLGTGLGFSHQYRGDEGVAWTLYGDGTANQGQVFESLNMAALWKLPLVYICENNQYGMGTSTKRSSASDEYYKRGHYVPGVKVDGMNVLAVREACSFAREHALKNGPIILEMNTYRYHGHSMSDPGITYRSRDEVSDVRSEQDAVARVKKYIVENELGTEDELKDVEKRIKKEVETAVENAKAAPYPPQEEMFTDVYVGQSPDFFMRGCDMSASSGKYGTTS